MLANQFALSSSCLNYPPRFVNVTLPIQTWLLRNAMSHTTPIDPALNQAFSINELLSAINDTENTTPGPDICYEMFKHMSIKSLEVMLQLFNKIWFGKQYVWDYVAKCGIPLAYSTDLLIAEVVAWSVLDCEFNWREFVYGSFILYWWIPIVAFVCVSNKQQSIKTKPIVFTVVRIFKEVSEVGQMVKASHEICDNRLGYGNKTHPTVGILSYPKTTLLVLI